MNTTVDNTNRLTNASSYNGLGGGGGYINLQEFNGMQANDTPGN